MRENKEGTYNRGGGKMMSKNKIERYRGRGFMGGLLVGTCRVNCHPGQHRRAAIFESTRGSQTLKEGALRRAQAIANWTDQPSRGGSAVTRSEGLGLAASCTAYTLAA
jgi:hypothetical protein